MDLARVRQVPVPPLSAWGLSDLAWIVAQPRGVTYQDTYFLETNTASSESIHFHDLVHAVQWRVLGLEDFLLMYAAGLAAHGYEGSPLEAMAYAHQVRFESGGPPHSVEAEVGAQTLALLPEAMQQAGATPSDNLELIDPDPGMTVTLEQVCKSVRLRGIRCCGICSGELIGAGWDGPR